MLSIFPSIHGNVNFSKLLDAYPEVLRKMFQVEDYTTGPGYLRAEVFSFVAPLLLTLFAVLWGSDLVAGEEERHQSTSCSPTPSHVDVSFSKSGSHSLLDRRFLPRPST